MPVRVKPLGKGHYKVSTPKGVKAHSTTHSKALRLKRLLNAVDNGWKPKKGFGVR